jgi:hypothetical protein
MKNLVLRRKAQWEGGMDNVVLGDKVDISPIKSLEISADRIDCPLLSEKGECYGFTAITFPLWTGTLGELIELVEKFGPSFLLDDLREWGVSRRIGLDKGGIGDIQAERFERGHNYDQFRIREEASLMDALRYYFG